VAEAGSFLLVFVFRLHLFAIKNNVGNNVAIAW